MTPRREPSPDARQVPLPLAKAPARRAAPTPEQIAKTVTDRNPSPAGQLDRALRQERVSVNPVKGIAKFKEPEGRIKFLMRDEEAVVRGTLRPELRPLFTVSIHTGMRWSEQMALEWRDVDLMTRIIAVKNSKSGYSRQIPMNSAVRSALMDLGAQRRRPEDPGERLFEACHYTQADKFFPKAIEQAAKVMKADGQDAARLNGYTWHCNRHTFASRLAMAGVDLRTIQVLGGWRMLAMVQRYSHLAPAHLSEAVERLVLPDGRAMELGGNLDSLR